MASLRIGIVGLGIAGATLAAALRRKGLDATVFEQAEEVREVGAGIALWANSVRLLKRLGVEDDLERIGFIRTSSPIFNRNGVLLQELATTSPVDATPGYFVHRAELLDTLAALTPAETHRLGRRCVGVHETDAEAIVAFADGSSEAFDVVIGADGIHSAVLKAVVGEIESPTYSGLAAFRGIVANAPEFALTTGPLWTDNHRYFVAFPMSGGRLVNFVGVVPTPGRPDESWMREGRKEDLAAEFAGWAPEVTSIIGAVTSTFKWGLYFRERLPRIVSNRVALMGDAAHPMLIHAGMGAGQGIEDAFAMAEVLADAGPQDVAERLRLYQQVRFERASDVQAMTRRNALFLHRGAFGDSGAPPPKGMGETGWVIEHDAEAAAREAMRSARAAL